MKTVYLICGVSGSGKTWVCKQLKDKFHYIPHDEHYQGNKLLIALNEARLQPKPIITECPFGERVIRDQLAANHFDVKPYFVIEDPRLVQQRYQAREHKELPKAAFTRATTIRKRADEWQSPFGTANEILDKLRAV